MKKITKCAAEADDRGHPRRKICRDARTESVRLVKRLFMLCFLMSILMAAVHASAVEQLDFQESQLQYGAYVAELNRRMERTDSEKRSRGSKPTLVFMRTDGEEADLSQIQPVQCIRGPQSRYTLAFASRESAENAIRVLLLDPHVLYAETDSVIEACETALVDDIPFRSHAAGRMGYQQMLSWARKCSGSSNVAVIDSGVAAHADFSSRLALGWDYVDSDDDPGNDGSGHGTHVAGIIADCTQGASVSLYAIRVLDASDHGKASNAANGVLEAVENGMDMINLSFASATE